MSESNDASQSLSAKATQAALPLASADDSRRRWLPALGDLWTESDTITGERVASTPLSRLETGVDGAGDLRNTYQDRTQSESSSRSDRDKPKGSIPWISQNEPTPRDGLHSAKTAGNPRLGDDPGDTDTKASSDSPSGNDQPWQPQLNPIQDWNRLALDIATRAKRGPTISARLYALTNTALYDSHAIFSDDEQGYLFNVSKDSAIASENSRRWLNASKNSGEGSSRLQTATMGVTTHQVMLDVGASLFGPAGLPQDLRDRADQLLAASLSGLDPSQGHGKALNQKLQAAQELGQAAADAILAHAWTDGSNQRNNYADTSGYQPQASSFDPNHPRATLDSSWQPLPIAGTAGAKQKALTPHWGGVQVFAGNSSLIPTSALSPYNSQGQLDQSYTDQLNDVLLSSITLTAEQKASAEFWELGNGTSYPPGKWLELALSSLQENGSGQTQSVQQMFAISQALHSAAVLAWGTKFTLDTVRPITAIQQYYYGRTTLDDGITPLSDWQQQPIAGQNWKPYLATPAFPEVVSGHSTFSAAAGYALSTLLGSNSSTSSTSFTDSQSRFDPNGFDGIAGIGGPVTLSWNYWSEQTESAGQSRIYGGIHFEQGNLLGQILGYQIGNAVVAKAQNLFGSNEAQPAINQMFGTMKADTLYSSDTLTSQENELSESFQQIYGFAGDDLLIAGGNRKVQLFGGDGDDRFRLAGSGGAWIRDYQSNRDTIEIAASISGKPIDLEHISIHSSSLMGHGFSDLTLHGDLLATLDGIWTRQDIRMVALS